MNFLWLTAVIALITVITIAADRIPTLIVSFSTQDPEFIVDAIEILGWLGALIGLLWLSGILTITMACAGLRRMKLTWHAGETLLRRWSPRFLRHLIAGALGVGLSAGIALPSHAAPEINHSSNTSEISVSLNTGSDAQGDTDSSSLTDHYETADLPSTGWDQQAREFEDILETSADTGSANQEVNTENEREKEPQTVLTSTQPSQENHHVTKGESLWTIARDHLNPDASETEVDAAWRQWYEQNKDAIGPNPNLIHPGTELTPPSEVSEVS